MRRFTVLLLLVGITACFIYVIHLLSRPAYSLTLLDLNGASESTARAITENGLIVGYIRTEGSKLNACYWQNGTRHDLEKLTGWRSEAYAANSHQQIVGYSSIDDNTDARHACVWNNGKISDLGTLGGLNSTAYGINECGDIVGKANLPDEHWHAVIWKKGKIIDLGTLGGSSSEAIAINDHGQIVGESQNIDGDYHAFLWENGRMTDLGTLGGETSYCSCINNSGEIVGWSEKVENGWAKQVGFHYGRDGMKPLLRKGYNEVHAYSINQKGVVVGSEEDSGMRLAAVLHEPKHQDLNQLVRQRKGLTLTEAKSINNSGQIVGTALIGERRVAILLTLIHEDSNK